MKERYEATIIENHPNDSRVKLRENGIFQTLSSRMGTGGGNTPMILQSPARNGIYCLEGNGSRDSHKGNGYKESETMFTLNTVEQHGVAVTETEETTVSDESGRTLGRDRASYNQGANAQFGFSVEEEKIGAQTAKGPGAVCERVTSIVRRLTPTECELLQGFPKGWTDIGDWTDSKGKVHKGDSDAPRYKALGNSIAVGFANNCSGFWMWLMKRISAQYERSATLGSLFDGISGFPLAWAKYNGPENCRWSSEIEEFPIAVCKKHFGDEDNGIEGDIRKYL